jgi:hypothetical protein
MAGKRFGLTEERRNPMTHELAIMDRSGDLKLTWNPNNPAEVEACRKNFEEMRRKGYMAYKLIGREKGEVLHSFDPTAKRIVMTPAMQGG